MSRPSVAVVGHLFGPLGISHVARCSFASFRAVGVEARAVDVWRTTKPGPEFADIAHHSTRKTADFNLFHLNGDEIERALEELGGLPGDARNAICPMWELPRYPAEWARQLERFDEVWAGSQFIADAIAPAVSIPVVPMPLATQVTRIRLGGRRYFAIPEHMYAFLLLFDLRSYAERKNPLGVIEAFSRFLAQRPSAQACLVVKVHGTANEPEQAAELSERIAALGTRAVLIDRLLDEDEVHALIYNCDALISLHRAEGYGLGLAEAMCLGKPVVATAYSGNLDFMNESVARMVPYSLVPVPAGAYPHWEGQHWADPDIDAAARAMAELYDAPESGRELGRRATQHMQAHFSFRAAGLRYLARVLSTAG